MKAKKCKSCQAIFTPRTALQSVCSPLCAIAHVKSKNATKAARDGKATAKKARADHRADKIRIKSRQSLIAKAKDAAQLYARMRDSADGCISCDKPANWGGVWHGSHFIPATNSATRLNLWNISKSCSQCNLFKGGMPGPYRVSLIEKIGLAKVLLLEGQKQVVKHSPEYLRRYAKIFNKRARILKKRIEACCDHRRSQGNYFDIPGKTEGH